MFLLGTYEPSKFFSLGMVLNLILDMSVTQPPAIVAVLLPQH